MQQIAIIIITLFSSLFANAQILSLDSVLSLVDRNNPMLRMYDSRVQAANAYSEGASNWMAPMVGAGTFMTPYPGQKILESRDKGFVMFSIEQNIPNPIKQKANTQYLKSKAAIEIESRSLASNALRAEAKGNYYQSIVLNKKLRVLGESKRIIQLMIKIAQVRYPNNQGNIGTIYKAEARLHEIENMQFMVQGEIEENMQALLALINLPEQTFITVDTSTVIRFDLIDNSNDSLHIPCARSDIRQIDKTIETMRYDIQLQQAQAKPDFRVRYDHMSPLGNMMPNQFTLMAMVSIPIAPWSSRMYKAEIKSMHFSIESMNKNREAILREAQGSIRGMAEKIKRMKQQLENYETKIIPALHNNYETLMIRYEENQEQLPMVIDGWDALNMARLEYLNKTDDYYKMIVQYEKELEK